jgi:hypothetical protein
MIISDDELLSSCCWVQKYEEKLNKEEKGCQFFCFLTTFCNFAQKKAKRL